MTKMRIVIIVRVRSQKRLLINDTRMMMKMTLPHLIGGRRGHHLEGEMKHLLEQARGLGRNLPSPIKEQLDLLVRRNPIRIIVLTLGKSGQQSVNSIE
jgi:hypothetical protein